MIFSMPASASIQAVNEKPTQDDIKIGVIDVSYKIDADPIKNNVEKVKAFGTDNAFNQNNSHGTAVAELVVDRYEDADLYLAASPRLDSDEFEESVDWMIENDVDVIVGSFGYYGQPYDGSGEISEIAQKAWDNDIPFVASSGNEAESHWSGPGVSSDGDEWVEFTEGDLTEGEIDNVEKNPIATSDSYSIFFSKKNWEDIGDSASYTLHLKDENDDTIESVTLSEDDTYEVLEAEPSSDNNYLAIEKSPGDEVDLQIFARENIDWNTPEGSIVAPASGEGSIGVGAYDNNTGELQSYSSQGPTVDSRLGVDLIAPDNVPVSKYSGSGSTFSGTSAAAPAVGGTIGGMIERDPNLTPDQIRTILHNTADGDLSDSQGHGKLNQTASINYGDAKINDFEIDAPNNTLSLDISNEKIMGDKKNVTMTIGDNSHSWYVWVDGEVENKQVDIDHTFTNLGEQSVQVGSQNQELMIDNGDDVNVTGGENTSYDLQKLDLSNVSVPGSTVASFDITSDGGNVTTTVSSLQPTSNYLVYKNGDLWKTETSSPDGEITFSDDDFSTNSYKIVTGSNIVDTSQVNLYILGASLGTLVIGFYGLYRRSNNQVEWI